jgi:hypothetical protein
MRDYRAYILAIDGHRFVWARDFLTDHPNDSDALDAAKRLTNESEVEVWEGSRLVARLPPGGEGMSPGLIPSLLSICEKVSVRPPEPISLSNVSDNLQFVGETQMPIKRRKRRKVRMRPQLS